MDYAELISKLDALPREKRKEVFDFVEFLAARCDTTSGKLLYHANWTDAEFFELSMRQALRGMEEDAVPYPYVVVKEWNAFNERFGSVAEQRSSL